MADILKTASNEQLAELFQNIEKRNNEFKAEYVDISREKLTKNRKERMAADLENWISRLTSEQKQVVSGWSDQIAPLAVDGLRNREKVLAKFRDLLEKRRNDPDFKETFVAMLVNLDELRATEYQKKIDYNTDVTLKFSVKISSTLKPTQRKHLVKRINSLAVDFEKISCDPLKIKPKQNE